jgi:hypothetical protein
MASKFNSEFNYRYQVIGATPWAKIQTLNNFLEGRIRAAKLEEVGRLKYEAKKAELKYLAERPETLSHILLNLQAEISEIESMAPAAEHAYALNLEEIEILKRLLKELYAEAEPTRIPGYTDEQMYEANAADEFTVTIGREIQAEIIANGRPSPAKIGNAMSNPHTLAALQELGLIPTMMQVPAPAGAEPRTIPVQPLLMLTKG